MIVCARDWQPRTRTQFLQWKGKICRVGDPAAPVRRRQRSTEDAIGPETENPNYKLIASMTEMEKSHQPWHGETGVIGKEMLARYLKDGTSPIYYIAGPPGMVKGLHMMINESGVDEGDIRTEEFSRY